MNTNLINPLKLAGRQCLEGNICKDPHKYAALCTLCPDPACAQLGTNKTIMGFPSQGSGVRRRALPFREARKATPSFMRGPNRPLTRGYGHARLISHAMANILRYQQLKYWPSIPIEINEYFGLFCGTSIRSKDTFQKIYRFRRYKI